MQETPRTSDVGENADIPMTSGCSHPHIISGDSFPSDPTPPQIREHGLQGSGESKPGTDKLIHSQKGNEQLQVWAGNAKHEKVLAGVFFPL